MNTKDLVIDRIGLSTRSLNALHRANIRTIGDLLPFTETSLREIRNIGDTSVQEILSVIEKYKSMGEQELCPKQAEANEIIHDDLVIEDFDAWINSSSGREYVHTWLERNDEGIEVLDALSSRSYNLLRLSGFRKLHQVFGLEEADMMKLPHMTPGGGPPQGGWLPEGKGGGRETNPPRKQRDGENPGE